MIDSIPFQSDYRFQLIDHQLVDFPDDFLYFLHQGQADTIMLNNLQNFGQLYPLLVQQQAENKYHLLAGYQYFTALKMLRIEKFACQILPSSIPPVALFSLQILYNLSSSQSSPILQAHLLQKAQPNLTEEELLALLSLMGYKPQRYKLKELANLLLLAPSAILALHQGILSQKSAKMLTFLTSDDQRHLTHLINVYKVGGSKQQKLVEMVTELALRDSRSVIEIVDNWLQNQDMTTENTPQQLQGLLQSLHEQCYPKKTAAEQKFKNLVQELQPPGTITVEHSLSFEDEGLEIRLRFANISTLREKWERIKTIIE